MAMIQIVRARREPAGAGEASVKLWTPRSLCDERQPGTMPRGSIIVLLLPALAEESWREDLGLHKTGQEQRRAAHWLADLDQAINFDLDTLATDHALRRSQI